MQPAAKRIRSGCRLGKLIGRHRWADGQRLHVSVLPSCGLTNAETNDPRGWPAGNLCVSAFDPTETVEKTRTRFPSRLEALLFRLRRRQLHRTHINGKLAQLYGYVFWQVALETSAQMPGEKLLQSGRDGEPVLATSESVTFIGGDEVIDVEMPASAATCCSSRRVRPNRVGASDSCICAARLRIDPTSFSSKSRESCESSVIRFDSVIVPRHHPQRCSLRYEYSPAGVAVRTSDRWRPHDLHRRLSACSFLALSSPDPVAASEP